MDSSGSSLPLSHYSTQTSGESSSSQGSKREICYSFPTFNNLPNNGEKGLVPIKTPEISLEKCVSEKQEIKNSCLPKQQVVKNRTKKNEKKCKLATFKTTRLLIYALYWFFLFTAFGSTLSINRHLCGWV
ncbi:hypothetical protein AAZX31_01G018600 [Glycine max]|uniref:Uncharacterized protein n=2 Tax=Glycine subgen. Soja TaxID=1462606 RepID=K7K1B3_SOYBN|nr:uncharacterized protein LOC106794538 [Glycine max]XP_028218163.1 uncharacterized protein LOC114400060 [Glycine soja]KAG4403033.1 hypothetical protein GLYMA_01G018900v4 [Glycine max]KAG5067798.1 hypothetical protein JHK85_000175 [Glycine max]KAG5087559.1 hypothetical protein JHK86_000171 [Glycine max]KAH1161189.1 hypothetical protein GYH30_000191 [Glycine max]KAH1161190.1 hypothetical protein GYH30_000191 [Glycine max]|eukprot:XP_014617438.1 uncharacterized protein LOC106794538 [Glycine max]